MDDYALEYDSGWDIYFEKFDPAVQARIMKKIIQLKKPLKHRHLKHGLPYFVEEAGGYRVAFQVEEKLKKKIIRFVGDHKQYEEWYNSLV
ncbi:hypothetical protein HZC09_02770 [Candidatus Micrarchaeota archaeon]|nr:hypothetical protein [Candidatus Micrarchaeota archaeon]